MVGVLHDVASPFQQDQQGRLCLAVRESESLHALARLAEGN
jgi:hypothetical protein